MSDTMKDAEARMAKAMDALRHHLTTIRTGRASPALLDRITVEYYGTPTPLNQVASVTAPEARMLVIQPWERNMLGPIEKAILKSDVGLNPNNDGALIRLNVPPLTEERRKQMVKQVHQQVEEAKVSVRNVRRDAMTQLHKLAADKQISEDDERRATHQLDEVVKRFTDEADKIGKAKEQEVLEV
ncbi:MAG: ribosome recycling factor [Thermomicrobiales bacterium]|nr:ribosome recycling factor [Thermomicrobiales bacterium]